MLIAFIGVMMVSFVVVLFLLRPKKQEAELESRLKSITLSRKEQAEADARLLRERKSGGLLAEIGEFVEQYHFGEDLQTLILHSGSKCTVGYVVGMSLVTAAGLALIAHFFLHLLPVDIAAFAAGAASQWVWLKWQKSRRLAKFNEALPDAIDLIARALRAGHSMSSAIEVVSEESAEPLASEFGIVFAQQKFGLQFRDALLQLGDRIPAKDLHFLITAILVQKETGGDLTEVLDRTTRVIRERVKIHGEIRTYTAQGRMTGWILGALPIIMLVIINIATPGYSHILFYDPTGQKLLYGGGTLIVIGGLIIRKIVDIQV